MEPRRAGLASRRGIDALCLNLVCLAIKPILVIVFCLVSLNLEIYSFLVSGTLVLHKGWGGFHLLPDEDVIFNR
jgi:hypothetical protein